jgi:hypothetical protein
MIVWFTENWVALVQGISMVVAGASVLVHLTPTTKDDGVVAAIQKVLNFIALNKKA